MKTIRIALAQINPTVGGIEGNVLKICDYIRKAREQNSGVVVFPELAITGYPPEDLLLKQHFIDDNLEALSRVIENTKDIAAVVGFVDRKDNILYNAAAIIRNRKIIGVYHKVFLPNYGVFDEYRYFRAGTETPVYTIDNIKIGVNICEDIWYPEGPAKYQALAGAEVILNINASPYHMGKAHLREKMVSERASDNKIVIAYLNTVGGQDELVFDGGSFVVDKAGEIIVRGRQFEEEMIISEIVLDSCNASSYSPLKLRGGRGSYELKRGEGGFEEEVYKALVLGTRDYVIKNDFKQAVIGLSGGIDSALVAAVAVDAIGRENVSGIFMPSPYTSKESREDAYELAKNLGIKIIETPISNIFEVYRESLKMEFKGLPEDKTEENLQARIRGNILMAFSNKFGWLVLTTGNKSEMSVGYATLYGDMAGGFAVIKDVPKTLVYELCKWKNSNEGRAVIPERVLWKEPSAELKPDQKDTDSLPPYPVLDPVLKAYIEDDKNFDDILSSGCEIECTKKIIQMIDRSEYKRRQSPPGIKITPRAFGRDRRFPITNKYRSY
ncbi:MAG: NAD+ synthase [Nitrospirae bacterium CG02_land_8_20_14_3_00_44_33]|nr:MAG: NAD+ synthase [Nitrospirae bacterium CG1_02_44_142]PIV40257.1 MAG: NAD+ synthase [Nitrospirae bacterium CG02_land_8_20_14_3_00_44_33]PIV66208.1 MAG: NAD+ synthase [Nitrospirae bacterium CG01_land_8_20_14_3_00_44_22]